ncbi:MAG: polyphosphate kinase 1 [Clostridia bacterium]|nr:polyphosphate kinase 1 [Clostridia bacterium]
MAKNKEFPFDTSFTQNREISWLEFNKRVLEEAADESVPLLERLKFISIFVSNLDEFFMVRVGSLFDLSILSPKELDERTGQTPSEQLSAIYEAVPGLISLKNSIYRSVSGLLLENGIQEILPDSIQANDLKYVQHYFKNYVSLILSPQVVDAHHPFPHLESKDLYIVAQLRSKKSKLALGIIPVPKSLPAFITIPNEQNIFKYIRIENVILLNISKLFLPYVCEDSTVISVTRNADIRFEDEKFEDGFVDYRNTVSKLIKKRSNLAIVRLEISKIIPEEFLRLIKSRIPVDDKQIYFDETPLNMKYVYSLCGRLEKEHFEKLLYQPYVAKWPCDIDTESRMIDQINDHDLLLFFPFDPIEPFLRLLNEAAEDPNVIAIKITIYRLSSASRIAQILCRAAENGKEVTALFELRARFDEENNIVWSEMLENSGCHVIYGIDGYKCHSKICLITFKDGDKTHHITQIGTGNYNEKTSTLYTDLSFMTSDQEIADDALNFFQNMLVSNLEGVYNKLLVAPNSLKQHLLALMDEEIQKGSNGYIFIKANSLTERNVIDKLCEASVSGAQINLLIRGICCIIPGIHGKTDNIHVHSIVGRYLEHSRIYQFGKGENCKLFISSADMMTRNLDRRVEIACPIEDKRIKAQIQRIINVLQSDDVKAKELMPSGNYIRKSLVSSNNLSSQDYFMSHTTHEPLSFKTTTPKASDEKKKRFIQRIKQFFKKG